MYYQTYFDSMHKYDYILHYQIQNLVVFLSPEN